MFSLYVQKQLGENRPTGRRTRIATELFILVDYDCMIKLFFYNGILILFCVMYLFHFMFSVTYHREIGGIAMW